jgi:NAD(P)-dependent dehydrogenase (short-subunit alcohol dehydrogenase family)
MSPLIAFIIGAGRNIGEHTAAALKAKGFKVALGSRKPDVDQIKKDGYFPVAIDAESPVSVQQAFSQVNQELGGPPNVVIFNGICFSSMKRERHLFYAFA